MLSAANTKELEIIALEDSAKTNISPEEKSARDGLFKALLDISSATAVGVTRNDYGSLLAKAHSAFEYGRTKLSAERHKRFLACSETAIKFYTKANEEWDDYFKYDWEREQDETLMSAADFYELRLYGVTTETSDYKRNNSRLFYVPFHRSLNLYWKAADIYVDLIKKSATL
jgi:hypothetical protein